MAGLTSEVVGHTLRDGDDRNRLCQSKAFTTTSGVVMPVDREMLEEVLDEALLQAHGRPEQVADDRRFASAIYARALERGLFGGGAE